MHGCCLLHSAKEKEDEVTELKQAMDVQAAEVEKIKQEMNAKLTRQQELASKAEEATKKQEELQEKIAVARLIHELCALQSVHQCCLDSHIVMCALILLPL